MFWSHLQPQPFGNSTPGALAEEEVPSQGQGVSDQAGRGLCTKEGFLGHNRQRTPGCSQCQPGWGTGRFCACDTSGLTDSFPKSLLTPFWHVFPPHFFLSEIPTANTTSPASLNAGNADYLGRCPPSLPPHCPLSSPGLCPAPFSRQPSFPLNSHCPGPALHAHQTGLTLGRGPGVWAPRLVSRG